MESVARKGGAFFLAPAWAEGSPEVTSRYRSLRSLPFASLTMRSTGCVPYKTEVLI